MEMTIRPAEISDIDALLNIESICFVTDHIKPRQMRYLVMKAKALFWVAVIQQKVVGYGLMFTPKASNPARLYSLAVLPEYRSMKIGFMLLESLLLQVKKIGYKSCKLEVLSNDQKTIEFYQRFGFTKEKFLPEYYQNGKTALRMLLVF